MITTPYAQVPRRRLRSRWTANLILLTVTLVWGATFTLTKDAIAQVPVFWFLAARFWVASAAFLAIVFMTPHARRALGRPETWRRGLWLGVLLFGTYALQTFGLATTTPATAGFLTGLNVVLVPILAYPLLGVRPSWRTGSAAVLAAVGLGLLCGFQGTGWSGGDLLVLLCAVCVALQVVETERWGQDVDPLALSAIEVWGLTFGCTAAALWEPWPGLAQLTAPGVWQAILICAIPGTALAYWAQTAFQQHTSSAQTAIIFSMEPVFAAAIGWAARGDQLGAPALAGCVILFASMLLADPNVRVPRFWAGHPARPFRHGR